ncbi:hypothetical protein [uncultured Dysosmobacter sp.]|uniref:hypothetical protein n=1 Tax=uncultured Dysosmobacter sp. TaxID=2591384 RepID=UPI00262CB55F|nr:hypothetical protein [uncultured Dysosmobacter sp.]
MKNKRMLGGAVLAAVVLYSAWMLWPRPLAAEFDAERQFAAAVTKVGVKDGKSWTNTDEQYDLEGSAALREVLEGYSYHLCWESLTGGNVIDGRGGTHETLHLGNSAGDSLISNGTARLFLNHRVVKVGYWGNRRGTELNRELLAALREE